jgi:hypothetical protein
MAIRISYCLGPRCRPGHAFIEGERNRRSLRCEVERPAVSLLADALAPVSGYPHISPAARNPSPGNPHRARPWRLGPVPTYPDIPSPVPAVIPGHPYPACMQRRTRALDNHRWRRTPANNDLRCGCTYGQTNPAYYGEQAFSDSHLLSAKSCENSLYDGGQSWIVKNQPERRPRPKALRRLMERFECWNDDRKRGARVPGAPAAANTNLPAVSLHDLRRDPKAQTRSPLTFGSHKRLEDGGQHVVWNACACVSDGQANKFASVVWVPVLRNAYP